LVVGAIAMAVIQKMLGKDAKSQAKRLLEQAKLDAENLVKKSELDQKEKQLLLQNQLETDLKKQRDEIRERENLLNSKEQSLKQATDDLKKQEKFVESNQRKAAEKLEDVGKKSDQYTKLITQAQADLQRVTGLSKDEAKKQLMDLMERELQGEIGSVILKHEKKLNEVSQQKAQDILLTAMQRFASSQTAESTTSSIDIANDEMKGRIIGREGRNMLGSGQDVSRAVLKCEAVEAKQRVHGQRLFDEQRLPRIHDGIDDRPMQDGRHHRDHGRDRRICDQVAPVGVEGTAELSGLRRAAGDVSPTDRREPK
jgi:uncharacterized protein (DUF3084 family)